MLYDDWGPFGPFLDWERGLSPVVHVGIDRTGLRHFEQDGPVGLQLSFNRLEVLSFLFVFKSLLDSEHKVMNEAVDILPLTGHEFELRKTEAHREFLAELVFDVELLKHRLGRLLKGDGKEELVQHGQDYRVRCVVIVVDDHLGEEEVLLLKCLNDDRVV